MHQPVLIREVLEALAPTHGETILDGTFGAGGYTRAILESADCKVVALDRDPTVEPFAQTLTEEFGDRFCFIAGTFADMLDILAERGIEKIDGVVLDIGVSSMQLDQAERGFSFRENGPLDMRMSREGLSAYDIVNSYSESQIADILFHYGEERAARKIAKKIVEARAEEPITDTKQLVDVVHQAIGARAGEKDSATRTFQALRIAVNDELGQLERALVAAEKILKENGRLVVVSFHSLEDRIVKKFFQSRSGETGGASRHLPVQAANDSRPIFFAKSLVRKKPSEQEIKTNPRARSSILRAGIRTNNNN